MGLWVGKLQDHLFDQNKERRNECTWIDSANLWQRKKGNFVEKRMLSTAVTRIADKKSKQLYTVIEKHIIIVANFILSTIIQTMVLKHYENKLHSG